MTVVNPWLIWFVPLFLLGFAGFVFATWKTSSKSDNTSWRSLTLGGWALYGLLAFLPFAASLGLIVTHI